MTLVEMLVEIFLAWEKSIRLVEILSKMSNKRIICRYLSLIRLKVHAFNHSCDTLYIYVDHLFFDFFFIAEIVYAVVFDLVASIRET